MKILKGCVSGGGGWAGPLTYPCVIIFSSGNFFFKFGGGGTFIVYKVDMNSLKSHLL